MSKKKHKSESSATRVIFLVAFLCLILVAYKPLSRVLSGEEKNLEQQFSLAVGNSTEKLGEKLEKVGEGLQQLGKRVANQSRQSQEKKTEQTKKSSSISTLPKAGSGVEIPARLKKRSEQLLTRKNYTLSYNSKWNLPNWVAWELNSEKLIEREKRTNDFLSDPDLPASAVITTKDYTGSGYDRGHMCPAADSRWHWKAMQESFYMSNMCPQNHSLNSGSWQELEEFCRTWVEKEGTLYIVCGPIVKGKKYKAIGKNSEKQIAVPDSFFKVLLSMKNNTPLAIGFIYENKAGKQPMKKQSCSVDEVERITGIDFFPALSDSIEKQIEADCRPNDWGIKK